MTASSSLLEEAKNEMESARLCVSKCEKEISTIKESLRILGNSLEDKMDDSNSLEIAVLKVMNLPEFSKPGFVIQLSSPIESKLLSGLYDVSRGNECKSVFKGVDINTATLTFSAKDEDIPLGCSIAYEVKPLCEFDVLGDMKKQVKELEVSFLPDGKKFENKIYDRDNDSKHIELSDVDTNNDEKKSTNKSDHNIRSKSMDINIVENNDEMEKMTESSEKDKGESLSDARISVSPTNVMCDSKEVLTPIFSAIFLIEYHPSVKDKRDILYDMLNDVSVRKATAIDELRKSASVVNRLKTDCGNSTNASSVNKKDINGGNVIKPGFLMKGNKKITMTTKVKSMLMFLYNQTLSQNSFLRSLFIPVMKNYFLFFGSVLLMHYQGHKLALPPPV